MRGKKERNMSDRLSHIDGGRAFQEAVGKC